MALNRSRASFGGLLVQGSLAMSRTPGITPDRGSIVWPINDTQPSANIGNLVLQWGNDTDGWTTAHTWVDCRLSAFQEIRGRYRDAKYLVEDRRWRWRYPSVIGSYNVRDEENVVIPSTAQNPRELAEILLDAMGETGYSVAALPTDAELAPEVTWLYDNAAAELKKLANLFGCDVHLDSDNVVRIKARGVGTPPGTTNMMDPVTVGIAVEQPPIAVRAYAADTLFESWLELEPCAPELDGTIELLDDLTFKPAVGWGKTDPENFMAVTGGSDAETKKLRAHCQKYVWRMFRLKGFVGGRTKPPGYDADLDGGGSPWAAVTDMKLLLPLLPTRLLTGPDEDGDFHRLPAEVAGSWAPHGLFSSKNLPPYTIWTHGFRLDVNNGYVFLNRPCYRVPNVVHAYANSSARTAFTGYSPTQADFHNGNLFRQKDNNTFWKLTAWSSGPVVTWASAEMTYQPPVLALRCGYGLRQTKSGPRYHHTNTYSTGVSNGTTFEPLRKTEYQRIVIEEYTSDYTDLSAIGTEYDNKTTVAADLLAAATLHATRYQATLQPQTAMYHTPYLLETDGIVQQITYAAGAEEPFEQTVSVNWEHDESQRPAYQRWQAEKQRADQEKSLQEFGATQTARTIQQQILLPMLLMPGV